MKKKILFAATGATAAACALGHHAEASEYKVQAGDSLWLIANKHGITIEELKSLNNLTSNLIFPNQYLKVSKSSSQAANGNTSSVKTTSTATSTHTVKPGESLSLIAYKYNTTYQKIMALNNLDSFFIYPGQTLKVTGNAVVKTTAKPKPVVNKKPSSQSTTGVHVVEAGESVSLIAQNYNISVSKLMQLNGLTSYLIFPGQELKVSGNGRTTSTTSTSTSTNTSASTGSTYTVQPGDYLYKVAQMYDVTIEDIKNWNNLSSNVLYVNQKLIVKGSAVQQKPATSTPVVAPAAPTSYSPVFNHSNLYDYGQCTWYVFNKRAAMGKGISTYWWHAFNWANGARKDGYTVNRIPEVGAIAQTTQGAYGHVAFVERVNADGTILVSETNYLTPAGVVGYRTLTKAQMAAYEFIH